MSWFLGREPDRVALSHARSSGHAVARRRGLFVRGAPPEAAPAGTAREGRPDRVQQREGAPWIVVVAYTDAPSDARLLRQTRETRARGARVTLLIPATRASLDLPELSGVEVVQLPVPQQRGQTTLRGQLRFMRALRRWVHASEEVPAVVHVHNMPDYLCFAVRQWQQRGARVVLDVRDFMSELAVARFRGAKQAIARVVLRAIEEFLWRRVDHVITVHEPYREHILRAGGVRPEQVSVVLNAPDPLLVGPELRRPPAAGRFKIVFHGTVAERTGIAHVVRAMPAVLRRLPQARLEIIGAGNGSDVVRSLIDELALAEVVAFSGEYLPLSEVIHRIADADLAVVPNEPSRYTSAILPVKLTEYAVLGIPAVATRLPVIERYFGGDAVHYVEHPTPAALADAIVQLAGDPARRASLVATASRFAHEHGWDRYRENLAAALGLR